MATFNVQGDWLCYFNMSADWNCIKRFRKPVRNSPLLLHRVFYIWNKCPRSSPSSDWPLWSVSVLNSKKLHESMNSPMICGRVDITFNYKYFEFFALFVTFSSHYLSLFNTLNTLVTMHTFFKSITQIQTIWLIYKYFDIYMVQCIQRLQITEQPILLKKVLNWPK